MSDEHNVDRFLAWLNVQIKTIDEQINGGSATERKHDLYVKLRTMKDAKNSYCRISGGKA